MEKSIILASMIRKTHAFHCHECGKRSYHYDAPAPEHSNVNANWVKNGYYICKHCKAKIKAEDILHGHSSYGSNIRSVHVWDNGDKVSMTILYHVFAHKASGLKKEDIDKATADNIVIQYVMVRLTWNMKTGLSYMMGARIVGGCRDRMYGGFPKMPIMNMSRKDSFLPNQEQLTPYLYEVYEIMKKYLSNMLGYKINYDPNEAQGGVHYIRDNMRIGYLNLLNSWPATDPHFSIMLRSDFYAPITSKLKKVKRDKNMIARMWEIYPAPRSVKKCVMHDIMYRKDFSPMEHYVMLAPHITKVDNIVKLLGCYLPLSCITNKNYLWKVMVDKLGETGAVNKLITNPQHLVDTQEMWLQILDQQPEYKISFEGNMKAVHDRVMKDYYKMECPNQELHFPEEWRMEIDGYTFEPALDTDSLFDCGEKMDICVGSYWRWCLDGETSICYMKKDNDYVVCLEVRNGVLNQAKLYHNSYPDKELSDTIRKWCNANDINANCYDLCREPVDFTWTA